IADNAPVFDAAGADATPACFPPAFRGDALAGDILEPLAADARKGKDGFRNAWLKIVAGMIGVSPGQILDRDEKRQPRQRLADGALAVGLLCSGVAAATQDTWRPRLDAYMRYQRFELSAAELSAARPGRVFWDCAKTSGDCPAMVVLPAGQYMMGSATGDEYSH